LRYVKMSTSSTLAGATPTEPASLSLDNGRNFVFAKKSDGFRQRELLAHRGRRRHRRRRGAVPALMT
jgi:hypothetical protein